MKILSTLIATATVWHSGLVYAAPHPEHDARLEARAAQVCEELAGTCGIYKAECASSPMPNACLVYIFFELGVAEERCGTDGKMACYEENNRYKTKWMHELNIPNLNHPGRVSAIHTCQNESGYEVKSEQLKALEQTLLTTTEGAKGPLYTDYTLFYECFRNHIE